MAGPQRYIAAMIPTGTVTAEELLRLDLPGKRAELVAGVLVVSEPPGYRHGEVAARLAKVLMDHIDARGLGRVLAAETGFKLASDPDTVRAPDVAFVRRERLPDPPPDGYAELAPDLVVEVLSPGDPPGRVLAKIGDWLDAGAQLVWVVDPKRRQARVYRADGRASLIPEAGVLDGEDVVPGFTCSLGAIF
ncbi:MAG: Uma2 family endonuclease [Gemmatimonadales bacterium]